MNLNIIIFTKQKLYWWEKYPLINDDGFSEQYIGNILLSLHFPHDFP